MRTILLSSIIIGCCLTSSGFFNSCLATLFDKWRWPIVTLISKWVQGMAQPRETSIPMGIPCLQVSNHSSLSPRTISCRSQYLSQACHILPSVAMNRRLTLPLHQYLRPPFIPSPQIKIIITTVVLRYPYTLRSRLLQSWSNVFLSSRNVKGCFPRNGDLSYCCTPSRTHWTEWAPPT